MWVCKTAFAKKKTMYPVLSPCTGLVRGLNAEDLLSYVAGDNTKCTLHLHQTATASSIGPSRFHGSWRNRSPLTCQLHKLQHYAYITLVTCKVAGNPHLPRNVTETDHCKYGTSCHTMHKGGTCHFLHKQRHPAIYNTLEDSFKMTKSCDL